MNNCFNKIENLAEIPGGLNEDFSLEIYSANEAVLISRAEIKELDDSKIKILSGKRTITFHGDDIKISCFTQDTIKICGNLHSIEFE